MQSEIYNKNYIIKILSMNLFFVNTNITFNYSISIIIKIFEEIIYINFIIIMNMRRRKKKIFIFRGNIYLIFLLLLLQLEDVLKPKRG